MNPPSTSNDNDQRGTYTNNPIVFILDGSSFTLVLTIPITFPLVEENKLHSIPTTMIQ